MWENRGFPSLAIQSCLLIWLIRAGVHLASPQRPHPGAESLGADAATLTNTDVLRVHIVIVETQEQGLILSRQRDHYEL